jgi:serine/threonine protein phosphatase PrpC
MNEIRMTSDERPSSDARNEDRILSVPAERILVVADGFGGGGGVQTKPAAERACAAVREFLVHEAGDLEATLPFVMRSYFSLAGNVLFNALIHANRLLVGVNAGKSVHEKTGASVAAAFLDGEVLSIASVGGCSAWFIRDGRKTPLLIPRTWGRLVDPTRADRSPESRIPLMALGISEDLEPEVVEVRVRPGDRLWLGTFEPHPEEWESGFQGSSSLESHVNSNGYQLERSWVSWEF